MLSIFRNYDEFDKQYRIVLNMIATFIEAEEEHRTSDVPLDRTVLFNLLDFNIISLTTEAGRDRFSMLLNSVSVEGTVFRLMNLQLDIDMRIDRWVTDLLKQRYFDYLEKELHIDKTLVAAYRRDLSFTYLVPLLQLAYRMLRSVPSGK